MASSGIILLVGSENVKEVLPEEWRNVMRDFLVQKMILRMPLRAPKIHEDIQVYLRDRDFSISILTVRDVSVAALDIILGEP